MYIVLWMWYTILSELEKKLREAGLYSINMEYKALERELHKAAELITWLRESVIGKLLLEALMATLQRK